MRKKHLRIVLSTALVSLLVSGFFVPSYSKEAKKLAILPFTMNADRDLSFLQEGIVDMLGSRLSWKGELEVLEKGLVKAEVAGHKGVLNRDAAIEIGKRLQVDYVVLGSLTVFGDSVSVDARVLDVANSDELVSAFNQAKGMDAVIPTITQFALDINEKVMGRPMAPSTQAAAPESPSGPGGLVGGGRDFEGKGVSHTQGVSTEVVSVDVGDADGDGKVELVCVSRDTVFVYKWGEKGGFVQFGAVKEKWGTNFVYVSVADMDKNGRAEIYVSNIGDTGVSSFVLEWDGKQFAKIAEDQRWFFRVMDMPGMGKVLLGQKREISRGFLGDVHILNREGNRFVTAEKLTLPPRADIFNFARADFDGTGKIDTVVLDSSDSLILYESGQDVIWKSDDTFGGTYTFIPIDTTDIAKEHYFLSSPLYVTDVDEDGKKEVMVCRNISKLGGRILARVRFFSGGAVHFLTRDQTGLNNKWNTKRLGGAIVGYQIADVDNDNLPELVVVSVLREESAVGKARSRIVVYDLK